jgi:CRP-like cAMP-binding protein
MAEIHALPVRKPIPMQKSSDPCQTCTARSLTICAPLNAEEQAKLSAVATPVFLQPHQMMFQEGDDADHVYNITCGSVSLSKSMADGRRQITGPRHLWRERRDADGNPRLPFPAPGLPQGAG